MRTLQSQRDGRGEQCYVLIAFFFSWGSRNDSAAGEGLLDAAQLGIPQDFFLFLLQRFLFFECSCPLFYFHALRPRLSPLRRE